MQAVHWHDENIIEAAGRSPEAVRSTLERHGQTEVQPDGTAAPTPDAVYQWSSRRKVPDYWRARLIYCLLADRKLDTSKIFRVGSKARRQRNYRKP